jgi:hypothetical protein
VIHSETLTASVRVETSTRAIFYQWQSKRVQPVVYGSYLSQKQVFETYCQRDARNHDKKKHSDVSTVKLTKELLLVVALPNENRFNCLCIPIRDRDAKEHKPTKHSRRQHAKALTVQKSLNRDKGGKPKHDHKESVKDEKGFMIFHLVPSDKRDSGKEFWIDFGQNIRFDDVSSPLGTSTRP